MFLRLFARVLWLSPVLLTACAAENSPPATTSDTTGDGIADIAGDTTATDTTGGCAAVHVITARASGEAAGEGRTKALVDQIVATAKQSVTRAAVDYPATLTNYATSSATGVTALKTQLLAQIQACPDQKIVLAGYSQGAHVVLDVLGGGGGSTLGALTDPVPAAVANHVYAVVTFGDPRHVTNHAFDKGTSTHDGMFPRTDAQLQVLDGIAPKIEAYCDTTDKYCDSGTSLSVHVTYLDRYEAEALAFVMARIGE